MCGDLLGICRGSVLVVVLAGCFVILSMVLLCLVNYEPVKWRFEVCQQQGDKSTAVWWNR